MKEKILFRAHKETGGPPNPCGGLGSGSLSSLQMGRSTRWGGYGSNRPERDDGSRRGPSHTGSRKVWRPNGRHSHKNEFTLFIDFLLIEVSNDELKRLFQAYGNVTDAFVPRKRRHGCRFGFAFVRFSN